MPHPTPQPDDRERAYDAVLVVSFGGPEGPADVLPFLENVLRGKNVPRERMLEVAKHYEQFNGVSPINEQNRLLIAALEQELATHGPKLPVYWGNRNWHPMLADTLQQMADDGVQHALAYMTSAFSSYSGCRQYLEDIERAQAKIGTSVPKIDKLRFFFNHPGYIEPLIENVQSSLGEFPVEEQSNIKLLFTAHSIPMGMADNCSYEAQLQEACRLVAEGVNHSDWNLVYQSRSGPPQQPWLEPDVCDFISETHKTTKSLSQNPIGDVQRPRNLEQPNGFGTCSKLTNLVISPIGFVSDHLEVLYDLDTEAKQLCESLGIRMVRAATVGHHPRFIRMIRELIEERITGSDNRPALGKMGASPDVCLPGCCSFPRAQSTSQRRAGPSSAPGSTKKNKPQ